MSETNAGAATPSGLRDTSFFGHPKGLAILFLTEMWERFSYYGMRGLLVLYLTYHFLFSESEASLIYGAYTALVYVMTIIGGTLADRYLGQRKAVTFGAILLVLGHGLMAFEGSGSTEYLVTGDERLAIDSEGRSREARRLYVEVDSEPRRLMFDSVTYVSVPAGVGAAQRWESGAEPSEGALGYEVAEQSRNLIERGCALLDLECAGEAPVTRVRLTNGESYPLLDTDAGRQVDINGTLYAFDEQTDTTAVILQSADMAAEPDAPVLRTIEEGAYTTETVKQELFVNILFLALALIIAGVGYLKANISTIVGELYDLGDPRRDSGFTLFYMGINLGSLLASLSVGVIGIVWGWAWGFGLAGIGMLLGLLTFLFFQHWLEGKAEPPNPEKLKQKVFGPVTVEAACYLAALAIIAVAMTAVALPEYVGGILGPLGLIMLTFMVGYAVLRTKGQERGQMLAATYFILAQIPFWALFEQAGSSLSLFTDSMVDRTLFGWTVPTPVFQSLNAGFIIMFAPILAWLWLALTKRRLNPSTPVKFAVGVFMAGLGFWVLVGGIQLSGAALVPVVFIFLIYWIHTMGELMLSPVGLSAVTKLAPARVVGMTMGAWFLFSGLSNFLAGVIASSTGAESIGGQLTDPVAAKATYAEVYSQVGLIAMAIAVVMLLISPIIKRMMGDAAKEMVPHPTETEAGGPSMDRNSDAP
ncbi:MAG: peptide MFS transporter [Oceanicaulis sp.]